MLCKQLTCVGLRRCLCCCRCHRRCHRRRCRRYRHCRLTATDVNIAAAAAAAATTTMTGVSTAVDAASWLIVVFPTAASVSDTITDST